MALFLKFQEILSLIFYRGDDNPPPPPPSTRPLCPCDRHTRNNIIPICPLCSQSILQYRILTPSDKPMWVVARHYNQVVDIVNLQQREKLITIVYKIIDTTLPLQLHAE